MSSIVVQVDALSKRYVLGQQEQYKTFRTALSGWVRTLGKGVLKPTQRTPPGEAFWALQEVSFEIKQGERVGIVGRNGAGKSTLLKILSRITEPTQGKIRIKGRVASLLEVGTGFHPELTGRENIFLNGAILGMSKSEISRKFAEIVAFAEVERFLDTPVKRYSSGMYVRLAFAVAAHLEPEILIVDEVLAVGDAQFQSKCLGKMQDVAHSGRTVIFVSHNMAAVRQLCSAAIFLQKGQLVFTGTGEEVVKRYLTQTQSASQSVRKASPYGIELLDIQLRDTDGTPTESAIFAQDYQLHIRLCAHDSLSNCGVVVRLFDALGTLVSSLCSPEEGIEPFVLRNAMTMVFDLPKLPLYPGQYRASVYIFRPNDATAYLEVEDALTFEVYPAIVQGAMWAYGPQHGIVRLARSGSLMSS